MLNELTEDKSLMCLQQKSATSLICDATIELLKKFCIGVILGRRNIKSNPWFIFFILDHLEASIRDVIPGYRFVH